jgi:uncharacterized protein (TIGR00369 family)
VFNNLFGEEPLHQEKGLVRWRYRVKPEHFNPVGGLHGGVIATLLDGVMGHAVFTCVAEEGAFSSAITLNVMFENGVREPDGTLTFEARTTQVGKRVAFTTATATDENGREIARATGTHAILRRT